MASENVSNQHIILEYGGDGSAQCGQLNEQVRNLKSQGNISQAENIIRQNYKCFEGTSHWEELGGPKIKPLEHPTGGGIIGSHSEFCRRVRHNYGQYKKFGMDSLADQLLQYDYCSPKMGYNPPAPKLEPNPKSVQYGPVKQGTTNTKTITISNTGESELLVDTVLTEGVHGQLFSIVENNTSDPIPAGDDVDIRVKFAPDSAGKKTATLTIFSNTNKGQYSISLDGGIKKPEGEREEVDDGGDGETSEPTSSGANNPSKLDCDSTLDECIPEVLDQYKDDAKRLAEGASKVVDQADNAYNNIKDKVNKKMDEVEKCIEKDAGPLGDDQEITPFEDAKEQTFDTAKDIDEKFSQEQDAVESLLSDPFSADSDPIGDFKMLAGLAEGLIPGIKAQKAIDQIEQVEKKRDEVVQQMNKVKEDMDKVPEITEELIGHNPSEEQSIINEVKSKITECKNCVEMAKTQTDTVKSQAETGPRDPQGVRPLNDQGEPTENSSEMSVSESVKKARQNPTMKNIADVLDNARDLLNLKPNKAQSQLENMSDNVDDTISKAEELRNMVKDLGNNLESIRKESTPSMKPIDKAGDKVENKLDDLEKELEGAGFDEKESVENQLKDAQKKFEALGNAVNDTLSAACGEINKAKQLGQSLENAASTATGMAKEAGSQASDAIYSQMAECQNQLNRQLEKTKKKESKVTKEDASLIQGSTACIRSQFNEFTDWVGSFDFQGAKDDLTGAFSDGDEQNLAEEAWEDMKEFGSKVGEKAKEKYKEGMNSIYGLNKEIDQCTTALRNCLNQQTKEQSDTTKGLSERNQTNEKLRREDARQRHKSAKRQQQVAKAKLSAKKKLKTKQELEKNLKQVQGASQRA